MTKELNNLVEDIAEECSFPQVGFNKESVRQHIIDILNERRRSVRKGQDYTQVCIIGVI